MSDFWLAAANFFTPVINIGVCIAAFFVNPFICLLYPPLPEFVPVPEDPPAVVEKYSIEDYRILYHPDAVPAEKTAAEILAETLNRITGGENFAAEPAASFTGSNEILVGRISGEDVSALGREGYLIKPLGEDAIVITGGEPRGTLYGVHKFLEKYLDCRYYSAWLRPVPSGPAEIPAVKEERYVPPVLFRETCWASAWNLEYSVANGLNNNIWREIPEEWGGTDGYNGYLDEYGIKRGYFAHTMVSQFVRTSEFFGSKPEWFAWRDSENRRMATQLCLTNPEVLAQMIKEVRAALREDSSQPIISITQEDNDQYCQCAQCRAVDDGEGSQSGTMIRFINAVADALKDEFPDVFFDAFAYWYTRTPPRLVKPRDNVIVRLCSIECCFAHPLNDPGCAPNRAFASDIKAWSKIAKNLSIWDYTTNFSQYNVIFPNFKVLQANMQFFVENNAKGVFEQGNGEAVTWLGANSEFGALRDYLLTRLLWDPYLDYDAAMNEFLKAYYGGGWQYIREYLDLVCGNAGKKAPHTGMTCGIMSGDKDLLDLKINQINYADALWEKAIELAGDEPVGEYGESYRRHVQRSRLSWTWWKACRKVGEFTRLQRVQTWQQANRDYFWELKDYNVFKYREGWSDVNFFWQIPPDPLNHWWGKEFWGTPMDWYGGMNRP